MKKGMHIESLFWVILLIILIAIILYFIIMSKNFNLVEQLRIG